MKKLYIIEILRNLVHVYRYDIDIIIYKKSHMILSNNFMNYNLSHPFWPNNLIGDY